MSLVNEQIFDGHILQFYQNHPNQYILASTPHHPLMYFTLHQTIHRLFDVKLVDKQFVISQGRFS